MVYLTYSFSLGFLYIQCGRGFLSSTGIGREAPMVWWLLRLEPVRTTIQYQKIMKRGTVWCKLHPGKLTWNLKITKENNLPNHHGFGFYVKFPGCTGGICPTLSHLECLSKCANRTAEAFVSAARCHFSSGLVILCLDLKMLHLSSDL